jgi:catechol 2,3-dioxygenase-like lactoylglutathione lyase family enzyme
MQILETDLLTKDLAGTEKFYSSVLGLRIIEKTDASLLISCGRSVLRFLRSEEKTNPVYHFAFAVPYVNFKEAVTWASIHLNLINLEHNNVIAEFINWNARAVYFKDNNGNILEFISRTSEGEVMHEPFDPTLIQHIAEVGIVTDSVAVFARQLSNTYKIPVYEKQPLHDNFGAMGDDSGLLILSSPGREWYPTEVKAEKHYSKVKLMHNEELIELTFNEQITETDHKR